MSRILKHLLLFAALLASALLAQQTKAESVSVTAILIQGSNEGGGIDSSLSQYGEPLRRILRFDTFKQLGRSSASIEMPGNGKASLPGGHTVSLKAESAGNKIRLSTQWTRGNSALLNTTIVTAKGQPTVLGGPSSGNGKLILILVPR